MEANKHMDILVLVKRVGTLLNEVYDVSRQLAEAMDRQDQVSVEMLVAMRREPVDNLLDADGALRDALSEVPNPQEGQRLAGLLNGEAPPGDATERMLAEQAASNRRRLKQVLELDRILNKKLTREKSVYQ